MTKPQLFAGTSGWAYASWKPGFYPAGVPSRKFLEYYSSRLSSVEVNYTFRQQVSHEQLNGWLKSVPEDFRFSFKTPATITHTRRLRDCQASLGEFLKLLRPASIAGKQGAVLLQFPPNFRAEALGKDRRPNLLALKEFLHRTRRMRASSCWHFAIEFRDGSWFSEEVYSVLRANNVALCMAQSDELATPQIHTADFSYSRLRASHYTAAQLKTVVREQCALAAEQTTFAYFKHEDAPDGALRALKLLGTYQREKS